MKENTLNGALNQEYSRCAFARYYTKEKTWIVLVIDV